MIKINEFNAEILLILAGLSFGNIPIISAILRDNNVSTIEQVMIRAFIAFIFAIVVLIFAKKSELKFAFSKINQLYYFVQGLILNIMIIVYFISIGLDTPVGEAALLVQIHPILTLILGALLLKERVSKQKVLSLVLALLGLFILIRPWEWNSFLTHAIGDFFALSNGIFYSFYLIIGRFAKNHRLDISPLVSISFVLIWMFITFLPLALLFTILPLPSFINSFSFSVYNSFLIISLGIALGLFGSVLPYGLIMIASRYVESSRSAILLLGEPLGAIILGSIILNEPVTIYYLFGGGLLLGAIIFLTLSGAKPTSKLNILIPRSNEEIN